MTWQVVTTFRSKLTKLEFMTHVPPDRAVVVIYNNPDYYPPTVYALRILRQHFQVRLVCRNNLEPIYNWESDIKIERLGSPSAATGSLWTWKRLAEYARFVLGVRRIVREDKPRFIYAYDTCAFAAVRLAVSESIPTVYHCHDQPELETRRTFSMQAWINHYATLSAPRASLVVYPQRDRAAYYMRTTSDTRQPVIVPNCPSRQMSCFSSEFDELIEARLDTREILFTGAIGPGNGLLVAIRAMAHADCCSRLRLFGILATPDFAAEMSAIAASLGIASKVSYEGWQRLESLIPATMGCAVGLVCYPGETFNTKLMGSACNKLFEYAARGIPAVVPDNPSFRDFLAGETWVEYAKPGDEVSMAHAISSIFADQSRYRDMCRASRQAFEQRYNYERVFAPVLEELRNLVS